MTINEWAKDFRSFVNELQMSRDDYKGIMEYIDDAIALLKEQEAVVRCKDCKHYDQDTGRCYWGVVHGNAETWFCADGERR